MNIDLAIVARDLRLPPEKIERSVQLLDEGNTIPFITRFRKDQTGGLNEEQLLAIKQRVASLRSLAERKAFVLKSIQSQSKLTDELAAEIEKASNPRRLEDLYHPFKAKKQSRAQAARHQGLEPLANEIFAGSNPDTDMSAQATHYVRVDKGLHSVDDVIKGVGDLLAEKFSEDSALRTKLRKILWESGSLVSQSATPADNEGGRKPTKNSAATEKGKPETEAAPKSPPKPEPASQTDKKETTAVAQTLATPGVATEPASEPTEAEAPSSEPPSTETTSDKKADPALEPKQPHAPGDSSDDSSGESSEKSTFKMSAGNSSPDDDPSDDKGNSSAKPNGGDSNADASNTDAPALKAQTNANASTQHQPLKPAEADQTPPTTVVDPDAQTPVVADSAPTPGEGQPVQPNASQPESSQPNATQPKKKKRKKKKKKKDDAAFKDYYNFKQSLKSLPHHQVLAINRGERANRLKVKIAYDEKQIYDTAIEHSIPADHPFQSFLEKCVQDALSRLIIPSLEREIRRELTEKSEKHAVDVFATNLKNLLLTPPLRGRRVMAIDPGFKSGCSVAILDNQGQFIASDHLFVVGNQQRRDESRKKVGSLVKQHRVDMIAIGNGVGCRETEQLVSDAIAESLADDPVRYVIVNEAGASIYSTSEVGREELPDHTPAVRSAISIGRRLQNPISELVKISPANIGVGMYQHDVKAKHLSESLDEVVQFCVNRVGVDVNSASPSLLKFVSGMNALTARRVYEYCKQNGGIKNRQQLKEVSGLGEATFVQAAGFLRVREGDNPLDSTSIHPESYPIAEEIIRRADATALELFPPRRKTNPAVASTPAVTSTPAVASTPTIADDAASQPISPESNPSETPLPAADASPKTESETASSETASSETASSETGLSESDSLATPVAPKTLESVTNGVSKPSEDQPANSASDQVTIGESATAWATADEAPAIDASATTDDRSKLARRKEVIDRIAALDLDAIAAEKQVGKMLMTDLVRAMKKPLWDPRDKISKPISRRGILKADDLKPEMQLDAQVVNVVDFGVFVDIGLGESCLVHVSQLSTRYISDPQMVYAVGDILKVWVSEIDGQRRRVKLTAIRPGTKKEASRGRRRNDSKRKGARPPRADGKPAHARPSQSRQNFERKKTERRPPAKPKPVIPITDEMLKGDAPMRSFSDLLQFKKKSPEDKNKNGES